MLIVVGVDYTLSGGGSQRAAPGRTGVSSAPGPTVTTSRVGAPVVFQVTRVPWQLRSPLSRVVALVAGNRIRLFGGLGPADTTTPAIVEVNPADGRTTTVGSLVDPVHDAAGAVVRGAEMIFGGGGRTVVATVQDLLDQPGSSPTRVGTLPAPRADLATTTVAGQAIVVGGYDGTQFSPDVLATTDGITFTNLARLPQPVRYPAVAAVGGLVFVIGGELPCNRGDSTAVQVIDVSAHTATIAAYLPAGLSHAGATVMNGTIYLFGGRSAGHVLDTVSALDPATLSPKTVGTLPVAVSDMGVATVNTTTYLLGGEDAAGQPVPSVSVASLVPQASTAAVTSTRQPPGA